MNEKTATEDSGIESGESVVDRRVGRLRWKKHPQETGLRAIGARPRGSEYHDGTDEYATVYASGGGCHGAVKGWYFVARIGSDYENTCNHLAPDEATAKKQAEKWVKARLKTPNV